MNEIRESETFADFIFRKIDPKVRSTFDTQQIEALTKALNECGPLRKHLVDIRGVLPLFLMRYYFVLLMGIDRRMSKTSTTIERRRTGTLMGTLFFLILISSPFLLLLFIIIFCSTL